ncbi:MAG: hypothetical protein ACI4XJ_09940 [Eubacteriales bacterium]
MRKIIGFIPFSGFCVIAFLLFIPDSPNESYIKLTFSPELLLFFLCMLTSLSSAILLCIGYIKTGLIVGAAVPVCCLVSLLPDLINPTSEANGSVAPVFFAYLMFYICYAVCYFTYHHEINKK